MGDGLALPEGAHLLGGAALALSFVLLYVRRVRAVIDAYAAQAMVLAAAAGWQGWAQAAPSLYATALLTLAANGVLAPLALHRIARRLGVRHQAEVALGVFPSMALGLGLVALSVLVVLPTYPQAGGLVREDLALALSVVMLGLLVMATRHTALPQVVGLLSLENGLVLAAVGAPGLPLVAALALTVLMLATAIVVGVFLFRVRGQIGGLDPSVLGGPPGGAG